MIAHKREMIPSDGALQRKQKKKRVSTEIENCVKVHLTFIFIEKVTHTKSNGIWLGWLVFFATKFSRLHE